MIKQKRNKWRHSANMRRNWRSMTFLSRLGGGSHPRLVLGFNFVTKSKHYPMKFTYVIDRYRNICEVNEQSKIYVLELYFIGYVFRNIHTTGK